MDLPPGMGPLSGSKRLLDSIPSKPPKKKKSENREFVVPVLKLDDQIFNSEVFNGHTIGEVFKSALQDLTDWFRRQVGRNHYAWAKENLDNLKAAQFPGLQDDRVMTLDEESNFVTQRRKIVDDAHAFVQGIVDKLSAEKHSIEQGKAAAKDKADQFSKEALLQMDAKSVVVFLLKEFPQGVKTQILAEVFAKKVGVGFAKRYDKKLNHFLNEHGDSFVETKGIWKLK